LELNITRLREEKQEELTLALLKSLLMTNIDALTKIPKLKKPSETLENMPKNKLLLLEVFCFGYSME